MVWLKKNGGNNPRLLCWALALQAYDYIMEHKNEDYNSNVDCRSIKPKWICIFQNILLVYSTCNIYNRFEVFFISVVQFRYILRTILIIFFLLYYYCEITLISIYIISLVLCFLNYVIFSLCFKYLFIYSFL